LKLPDPEISVILPTRDRATMLMGALHQALSQERVRLEVIVVDDGSTDETSARLAALDDPRLRIIRRDASPGLASARNRAIAEANAPWIAFLDDDDMWAPWKLRTQLDAILADGGSFVYSSGVVVDESLRVVRVIEAPAPEELPGRILRWNVVGGPSTMMVRSDMLRELGGFDERFRVMEDWDLWIRLAQAGRATACKEVLVAYLKHPRQMQVVDADHAPHAFQLLKGKHRDLLRLLGRDPDELIFWRWVALGHLRAGRKRRAARLFLEGAFRYRSPGNVVRAIGSVFGEPAMERIRGFIARGRLEPPDWLRSSA
jgi:glycosyltransferase involved in cell wall biosynthesis